MDKEGQSIKFSTSQIPDKKSPDFFIGSNDKTFRRKKTFMERVNILLTRISAALKSYFKHPFAGKHKFVSIGGIAVIVTAIVLIILALTIWHGNVFSDDPSTPAEYAAWDEELTKLLQEIKPLDDKDAQNFFINAINSTKKYGIKYYDLSIAFARDLIYRGYAGTAQTLLDSMNTDDMDCIQVADYYGAYAYMYFAVNRENTENSMFVYYSNLETEQEEICQTEYPAIEIKGEEN